MEQKEKNCSEFTVDTNEIWSKRQKAAQSLPLTINSEESVLVQKRKEIAQSLPLTVNLEQRQKAAQSLPLTVNSE